VGGKVKVAAFPAVTLVRAASPEPRIEEVSLGLLGGFELQRGGHVIDLPMRAKRLLAFLALRRRLLSRAHISQSLWLDATEENARVNLRSALCDIGPMKTSLIDMARGHLALGRHVRVDVHRSIDLAERLESDGDSADSDLDEGVFRDDLLPDWYEDWIMTERETYRQVRLHALENLCHRLTSGRRFARAILAGLAAVAEEPLRESANLVLIRAYLAEGNLSEARRHYRWYRELHEAELGLPPSGAITQLIAAPTIDRFSVTPAARAE
jgi:DNA-binding SARP family transcriptional activator